VNGRSGSESRRRITTAWAIGGQAAAWIRVEQQVQACKNDSFYKGERNADEGLQWNGVDTFSRLHKGSNANGGRPVDGRPKRNQNGVEPSTSARRRQAMRGDWTRTTSQMMTQNKRKKTHVLYHLREKNYGPPATESADHDGSRRITKDHEGSRRITTDHGAVHQTAADHGRFTKFFRITYRSAQIIK
jgi:hypothetical protein